MEKLIHWYFTKGALPYWCLLIVDMMIVMVSALFTYWAFNRTDQMVLNRLFQYLTEDSEYKEFVISKQIYRSGTSIGANVRES